MEKSEETWRKFAFEVFAQITGWIAGPIIIALFVGKKLDEKYGTEPWLFLALIGVAFIMSCAALVKISLKYIKKIEKSADAKKIADQEQKDKIS